MPGCANAKLYGKSQKSMSIVAIGWAKSRERIHPKGKTMGLKEKDSGQTWWCTLVVPARDLRRQRDCLNQDQRVWAQPRGESRFFTTYTSWPEWLWDSLVSQPPFCYRGAGITECTMVLSFTQLLGIRTQVLTLHGRCFTWFRLYNEYGNQNKERPREISWMDWAESCAMLQHWAELRLLGALPFLHSWDIKLHIWGLKGIPLEDGQTGKPSRADPVAL